MTPKLAACSMMLALAPFEAQDVDFPSDPRRWYATSLPAEGSDRWYQAQWDEEHEWVVFVGEGGPRVRLRGVPAPFGPAPLPFKIERGTHSDGLAGRRLAEKVDDGWIVAFNGGEFGAGLWWFSPDGKKRHKISDDHVVDLFPTGSGLLALEGLAHGTMSIGKVARLSRGEGGRWKSEFLVNLRHAPEVATKAADGSLVVATAARLLRVFPDTKKIEVIIGQESWGNLYPNSIATTPSGSIFVGMRHGITRVEKEGGLYRISWLMPSREFAKWKVPEPPSGFR